MRLSPSAIVVAIGQINMLNGAGALPNTVQAPSRVRIDVTDYIGNPLPLTTGFLYNKGLKVAIHENEVLTVPKGEYTVEAQVPGFRRLISSVRINQPEQVLSLAMPLGSIDGPIPVCSIRGRSDLKPKNSTIRLFSLFGNISEEVAVKEKGTFVFENLECGDYVLLGIERGHCTAAMHLRVMHDPVVVKFSAKKLNCMPAAR